MTTTIAPKLIKPEASNSFNTNNFDQKPRNGEIPGAVQVTLLSHYIWHTLSQLVVTVCTLISDPMIVNKKWLIGHN